MPRLFSLLPVNVQVSYQYVTTDLIIVLYIFILVFLFRNFDFISFALVQYALLPFTILSAISNTSTQRLAYFCCKAVIMRIITYTNILHLHNAQCKHKWLPQHSTHATLPSHRQQFTFYLWSHLIYLCYTSSSTCSENGVLPLLLILLVCFLYLLLSFLFTRFVLSVISLLKTLIFSAIYRAAIPQPLTVHSPFS